MTKTYKMFHYCLCQKLCFFLLVARDYVFRAVTSLVWAMLNLAFVLYFLVLFCYVWSFFDLIYCVLDIIKHYI